MSDKKIDYKVTIIGAGPAGITAAIYGKRSGLDLVLIEGNVPGGNLVVSQTIENYPGYENITGPDLASKMYQQVLSHGTKMIYSNVKKIINHQTYFEIFLMNGNNFNTKFVIIATGLNPIKPDIPSLLAKEQKGVSYCAICDGALYKGKEVAVIGGGNSAVDESFFLVSISPKVHIILRRDVFRADYKITQKLINTKNVEVHYNSLVHEVLGEDVVDGITIKNVKTGEITKLPKIKAVFPYIGQKPQTEFLKNLNITDERGFIPVDHHCETKIKNLYAVGDVVVKELRQIITAVNDGGVAIKSLISKI